MENLYAESLQNLIMMNTSLKLIKDGTATRTQTLVKRELNFL